MLCSVIWYKFSEVKVNDQKEFSHFINYMIKKNIEKNKKRIKII